MLDPIWDELGVGVVQAANAGGAFGGKTIYLVAAEFGHRG
jgi:hypothetical protein